MILQALAGYYQRLSQQSGAPMPAAGLQQKEIPYIIVLDRRGRFLALEDTRSGEGKRKRARSFTVPREVKRSGSKAWLKANLLWDTSAYVLGYSKEKPDDATRKHERFKSTITETFPDPSIDEGLAAVVKFLEKNNFESVFADPAWKELEEKGGNISFRLDGEDLCLVCERPAVVQHLSSTPTVDSNDDLQACLVTGDQDIPAVIHNPIKGIRDAQSTGANIVSFNLAAFTSYGKEQSLNAPVGKRAEFAYVTALNTLLGRDSRQKIQVGDATTVFWASKENRLEDVFAELFGTSPIAEAPSDVSSHDLRQVVALFRAPDSGVKPELDPSTRFFVLGLAPNAARIAVRFWYAGTVGEVADHISQHFDDIEIVHPPQQPPYLPLWRLLKVTALLEKSENIAPNMAGACMKAILEGTPYPRTLLSAAVTRCRAEREVGYPRASLIKAILARNARYYHQPEKEVGMGLDITNTNVGYRLGRLFAVLEKAQEEANPGLNATIRDRFYGSASGTPVVAFSHLMKLKNHHIAKLENRGRAVNLERLIGEIMDGITDFPTHLRLEDQGRFAVGYYHQRQAFFTKTDTSSTQQ